MACNLPCSVISSCACIVLLCETSSSSHFIWTLLHWHIIRFHSCRHHKIMKSRHKGTRNNMKIGSSHKGTSAIWRPPAGGRRVLRTTLCFYLEALRVSAQIWWKWRSSGVRRRHLGVKFHDFWKSPQDHSRCSRYILEHPKCLPWCLWMLLRSYYLDIMMSRNIIFLTMKSAYWIFSSTISLSRWSQCDPRTPNMLF